MCLPDSENRVELSLFSYSDRSGDGTKAFRLNRGTNTWINNKGACTCFVGLRGIFQSWLWILLVSADPWKGDFRKTSERRPVLCKNMEIFGEDLSLLVLCPKRSMFGFVVFVNFVMSL